MLEGVSKVGAFEDKFYTTEYIFSLPEGKRAELVDGVAYDMAPPGLGHQRISIHLATSIQNYISENKGKCEVFTAPFGVFLFSDERTYVEPDLLVVCDADKLSEKGCMGAPDWVVEIVSKSSRYMDYVIKLAKYQGAGVREYWIIDEEEGRIMVYDFAHQSMEQYAFGEEIQTGIWEGARFTV